MLGQAGAGGHDLRHWNEHLDAGAIGSTGIQHEGPPATPLKAYICSPGPIHGPASPTSVAARPIDTVSIFLNTLRAVSGGQVTCALRL